MDKIFAIGDIHGCLDKLLRLMSKIKADRENDTIVFLGDYIDRGKDSSDVIEYLTRLPADGYHTIFLKGNHEVMFENYLRGKCDFNFLFNGGDKTIASYKGDTDSPNDLVLPDSHVLFFKSLRLYHETKTHIFVHAGLAPGVPLNRQEEKDLLWIRKPFIESTCSFGKTVVFGHTPFKTPLVKKEKIGIDTGAVYGNKLTCIELPAQRFYSA